MATWVATSNFDTYANYQIWYDILSTSSTDGYHKIRIYGILEVTGNYISWSSGTARVWDNTVEIGTYYSNGTYTLVTKDINIYCDQNGDFDRIYIDGGIYTTYKNGTCAGYAYLPHINRQANVINATDFTDEGNPTITFNNPGNFRINARLEFAGAYIQRENISNTGTYTFNLTTAERELLRSKIPNSNSLTVREVIATCYSGTTESAWSFLDKRMTIINANPIFSNFEFEDVNPTTVALTGSTANNVINVKGYSNIEATVLVNDIAEAKKSATMNKYRFKIGDSTTDIAYNSQEAVSGVINNASTGIYEVYAIDSRNNSTLITKLAASEIAYEPIFIDKQNSKIERDDNRVGDGAILTLTGNIWNNSFGDIVNSITAVTYKFKKTTSSTWITGGTTITPTITNNSFEFTGLIASDNPDTTWDIDASYNIEITISDELSSTTAQFILNSAVPTMCLDKNGVGIMGAYDNSLGGALQIEGKIIDGGKLLWANQSPNNPFGEQDITLSSDEYDVLEIYYYDWAGDSDSFYNLMMQKTLKGNSTTLQMQMSYNGSSYSGNRKVIYVNDTKLHFEKNYRIIDNSNFDNNFYNYWNVPLYIVGYKTNLFN